MFRRHLAVALVGAMLVACGESDKSPATAPNLVVAGTSLTCDATFRTIKGLIQKEFATPQQQTAFDILKAMQAGYQASGKPGATGPGFQLLNLIATTVDANQQAGTPQLGSDLSNATIACMDVGITNAIDFTIPLTPSPTQTDGAYEVRGGNSADPVVTRRGISAIGVKSGSWSAALGVPQALIYAQPHAGGGVNGLIGTAYDWNTVPVVSTLAARTLVVGICVESGKSLVQEDSAIVQLEDVSFLETTHDPNGRTLCGSALGSTSEAKWEPFAFLRRWLAPTPVYAAVLNPGGTGGLARGYSTFSVVDAGNLVVNFTQQPVDGTTSTTFTVKVQVTASNTGAPIEGVAISLTVQSNQGSFTVTPPVPTGTTDVSGVASIPLSIDKPGGYTLVATTTGIVNSGNIRSYPVATATSNLFNLKFP